MLSQKMSHMGRTLTLVACIATVVIAAASAGEEKEKLLFGFERGEVARTLERQGKPEDSFKLLENGDFLFFRLQPGYKEVEMRAIRPMRCVREKASQGKYSCKVAEIRGHKVSPNSPYYFFQCPRLAVEELQKLPQANLRLPELLNTSGWFDWVFPKDWSGYDALRVDVLLQSQQPESMMLEVEDDLVEPPVSEHYEAIEPGKWVTLELDLVRAVEKRGLNLKKMNNIWLRFDVRDSVKRYEEMDAVKDDEQELKKKLIVAYVDNIRLCRKGTVSAHPVLKGKRSAYTAQLPRAYAAQALFVKHELAPKFPVVVPRDTQMPEPAPIEPGREPIRLAAPSRIDIQDMLVKGCLTKGVGSSRLYNYVRLSCTAAYDAKRIVVGFTIDRLRTGSLRCGPGATRPSNGKCAGAAVGTTDGGNTWKGIDGSAWPTVLGVSYKIAPRPVDLGADIMAIYDFGCKQMRGAHIGYPVDRAFLARSVFVGEKWWVSPWYFVSGDPRHCHWVRYGDVVALPSGRIWTAWAADDRFSYNVIKKTRAVWAGYSNDGGKTWHSWRGKGLTGAIPGFVYGRHVRLAPYRGQVAVFADSRWTWFDGKAWSKLEDVVSNPEQVVSCGEEIYLCDSSGLMQWYDGSKWYDFTLPGRAGKGGRVARCGQHTVLCIEPDESGKRLLCWRKKEGNEWRGPQVIVSEETPIAQIATQRYAPQHFAPVAYMCWKNEQGAGQKGRKDEREYAPWIKVLKVSAEPVVDAVHTGAE